MASGATTLPQPQPLRHIGLYGYRAGFLRQFPALAIAPLESLESLEQLRAMWHGHRIAVHISPHAPGPGVDTPEDLERVRRLLSQQDSMTHPRIVRLFWPSRAILGTIDKRQGFP